MSLARVGLAVLAAICVPLLDAAPTTAEPVTIKAGWINTPSSLIPIMFKKDGIAKHAGDSYRLEPVRFNASPPVLTALGSGDLDIGVLGFPILGFAIENAGMKDIRVIAGETPDGVDGYYSVQFFVRNDGPTRIEDLKGQTVATNGQGSTVDIAMRAMLRKHGLEYPRDYNIIEAPLPTQKSLLAEKKVALIISLPPFAYDPELLKFAHPLFTQRDAIGRSELAVWGARAEVIAKKGAPMTDLLEDYIRAIRWFTDTSNRKEAIAIAAEFTKLPVANFDGWLFNNKDHYRDPNGMPDLDALQKSMQITKNLGLLKLDIDVKNFADLSMIEEASKRLK
jgi:NitT/TauT family transport system substrate-binding protein